MCSHYTTTFRAIFDNVLYFGQRSPTQLASFVLNLLFSTCDNKWKELSDEGGWATCSCPNRLLWKWRIDPRRTLLKGTYSVVDVDISINECARDSRTLVRWFGYFVSLLSPRGILFVYWKIHKIRRNLQKVIWSFIRCHSKTISFNIKWLYRKKNYV